MTPLHRLTSKDDCSKHFWLKCQNLCFSLPRLTSNQTCLRLSTRLPHWFMNTYYLILMSNYFSHNLWNLPTKSVTDLEKKSFGFLLISHRYFLLVFWPYLAKNHSRCCLRQPFRVWKETYFCLDLLLYYPFQQEPQMKVLT